MVLETPVIESGFLIRPAGILFLIVNRKFTLNPDISKKSLSPDAVCIFISSVLSSCLMAFRTRCENKIKSRDGYTLLQLLQF